MKAIERRKENLETQLLSVMNFLKGSISELCANCMRVHCICDEKTKLRSYRLTYKDDEQKTKIVYIPRERLKEVKTMIGNYKKVRNILNKIMEVNVEQFKNSQ